MDLSQTSSKLPGEKYQKELEQLKKDVQESHDFFKENYERYNEFQEFVLVNSLSANEKAASNSIGMPTLEFNICEAYQARLQGELVAQDPSVSLHLDDDFEMDDGTLEIMESHMRHVMSDPNKLSQRKQTIRNQLTGGFGCFSVTTQYVHPMTFRQEIVVNSENPLMCGWDPLAREMHKGDGEYCYMVHPMDEETFKKQYPAVPISSMSFVKDLEGFSWTFKNGKKRSILVCEMYKKKKTRVKIVYLTDNTTMTEKEYKQLLANWDNYSEVPPMVMDERVTIIEKIHRYVFIENKVLEHAVTDYTMLPLVFVDGNSVTLKEPVEGEVKQVTKPYVYNVRGAQRLKNFSGNALANELENIVQHKFIIKKEALPKEEDFLSAITDIQKASTIVVNAFYEKNPNMPIPEPIREVVKMPAPPEVQSTFMACDSLMQSILGSYDAALGINDNQLSGVAVVESALHSNSAAMPFVDGYLLALQRVGQIYVDLFPKYYTSPRTIPILDKEGNRSYVKINDKSDPQAHKIQYETNALNIRVEAGASFQVQKSKALQQINAMMQASPAIAQFFSTKGLPILFDNMDIRGSERIRDLAAEWVQEQEQAQQLAMEEQKQAMQNNPAVLRQKVEMARLEQQEHIADVEFEIDAQNLRQQEEKALSEEQLKREDYAIRRDELDFKKRELNAKMEMETHKLAKEHAKDVATHHAASNKHKEQKK